MMSFFCSGTSTCSEKTGISCGPVSMASYMCLSLTPIRVGACLPPGSAPPDPAKLWQAVQLVRKNCPPSTSDRVGGAEAAELPSGGDGGPPASEPTYPAGALVSSSL